MTHRVDRECRIWCSAAAIAYLGGCAGVALSPTTDEPPDIPPASTFVIDFADFIEEAAGGADAGAQGLPRGNWLWSVGHVAVWNVLVTVTMAVPVAAFVESFNHEPQRDGDSWVRSYDVTLAGQTFYAQLRSTLVDSNIEWSMFISLDGGFDNVNWFTGLSNLTGTTGSWTLNRDPENVEPFLSIGWNRDPENGTFDISYTNIAAGDPNNGSSIGYGVTSDTPFDAVYEIQDVASANTTSIEWNRTTKAGQVRDRAYFGDDDWHCWDELLLNASCSMP